METPSSSSSSGLVNQEPKLLDDFQEAKETFSGDEEEEEEIFYDLANDFDLFMDRLIDQRRKYIKI